jgi:uncharacterized membrane protein YccC
LGVGYERIETYQEGSPKGREDKGMTNVSETLADLLAELRKHRDNEISMASEVLVQYLTDHNDKAAYRAIDKQVNALVKSWDKMDAFLEKAIAQAEKIEAGCENFYGV